MFQVEADQEAQELPEVEEDKYAIKRCGLFVEDK